MSASRRSRASSPNSSSRRRVSVQGSSTAEAIALRQKAMARAGAAVAAISGPEVETAVSATAMVARSVRPGSWRTSGAAGAARGSPALTRRVSRMDAAALSTLLDEATKKSGLVWVRPAGQGQRAHGVWHLWQDGAAYVLTGGLEQQLPPLDDHAFVTVRSKDK